METLAVIDFETTGLGATQGGRATEIAAVLVQGGAIVGRFQSLMNSGAWVPPFISQLTGISNEMLRNAPPARAVMHEVARFTRGCPLVAHNAAFDRGFWQAELERAACEADEAHAFACTMLLSRRLYPHAENHKLGTLARPPACVAERRTRAPGARGCRGHRAPAASDAARCGGALRRAIGRCNCHACVIDGDAARTTKWSVACARTCTPRRPCHGLNPGSPSAPDLEIPEEPLRPLTSERRRQKFAATREIPGARYRLLRPRL